MANGIQWKKQMTINWRASDIQPRPADEVELCIIGTGIAGLNALFAASEHLGPNDRVLVIDRKLAPGGMWTQVYDYSRLHQPHRSFTVGDMEWDWSKPSHYLSTGTEVRAHLGRCFTQLQRKTRCRALFGHTVTCCREIRTSRGTRVEVKFHNNGRPGSQRRIWAKRVIKAAGFDVQPVDPLEFTSNRVVSTTPERLGPERHFDERVPAYVIGGGKTAMDTAHALITAAPGRKVTLVSGRGTIFVDRDMLAPKGITRWWKGKPLASFFRDLALRFDGANEDEVFEHFRTSYGIGIDGKEENFLFGLLSTAERDRIAQGLHEVIGHYLHDVVDGPAGPTMILRGGGRRMVEPGAIFVNCTGHLLRRHHPYEPYLSPDGAILSITPRSLTHFLSSMAGYLLPHLFLTGKLASVPLYEVDGEGLHSLGQRIYHTAMFSLTFLNTILIYRALPRDVIMRCGLDIDRHYPMIRRLASAIDIERNGDRYADHCRTALDRVHRKWGVRCGPLAAKGSADPEMPFAAAEPLRAHAA